MNATAPLSPVCIVLDTTRDERERLIAYANEARRTIDEVARDAVLTVVDAALATLSRNQNSGVPIRPSTSASPSNGHSVEAVRREEDNRNRTPSRAVQAASPRGLGGKGENEHGHGGGALPGSLAGDAALLELLVHTLREALRVDRGEVLTDAVIERRARNGAAALASVIDEALDRGSP